MIDNKWFQFTSTDISIQRGGDGTLTWSNNIPFLCHGGYSMCYMELQASF